MKDESIDLVVTSPPYNKWYWSRNRNINNGFKTKSRRITYWDFDDNLLHEVYEKQQRDLLTECCRVLKPNGSIFYKIFRGIFKTWIPSSSPQINSFALIIIMGPYVGR